MTDINSSAQAGDNNKRSLDVIAGEINDLNRRNIFALGALLAEARDGAPGEHGEWLAWLQQFDFSYRTALNYLAAHDLAVKCETVAHLRVPPTIVYELADEFIDDPDLPAIVAALDKASKATKPLSYAAANEVVDLTKLRIKFGDYPRATLATLESLLDVADAEWAAGAVDELKKVRPTTVEAAEKILCAHRRKHLEPLFGGALPAWLDEMDSLDWLEDVEPEHRKKVLAKLQGVTQLDWEQVANIIRDIDEEDGDEDQDDDEDQEGDAENAPAPAPQANNVVPLTTRPGLDAELLAALNVILHHARRPMPTSVGGIEGRELVEAKNFIEALHEIATGGSTVKRIADAAEARSRRERAANGEGLTERWSES